MANPFQPAVDATRGTVNRAFEIEGREAKQELLRRRQSLSEREHEFEREQARRERLQQLQADFEEEVQARIDAAKDIAANNPPGEKRDQALRVLREQIALAGNAMGVGMVEDAPVAEVEVPGARARVRQALRRFDAEVGATADPTAQAETAARADVAGARAVAEETGVSEREALTAQGVAPAEKGPDLVTVFHPQSKRTETIDANANPERLQQALDAGAVELTGVAVEAATPEDALAPSERELREFREAEIQTRTVVSEIGRIREQLRSGDTFTGLVGTGVQAISGAAGMMLQTARAFGLNDEELLDPSQYNLSGFGSEAASTQAFRSNVTNLAYTLARAAEPGSRLSEPDVQRQIDRLAADRSDIGQITASLDEVERGVKQAFAIRHRVLSRDADLPPLPAELDPSGATRGETETLTDRDRRILDKPDAEITADDLDTLSNEGLRRLHQRMREQ